MKATQTPTPAQITSRVLASLAGSYGFVWGFTVLGIASLVAGGMDYDEAWTLVMLLAFILFLVLFCWAFVAKSLTRLWIVLAGGAALMSGGAWLLTRQLVS